MVSNSLQVGLYYIINVFSQNKLATSETDCHNVIEINVKREWV